MSSGAALALATAAAGPGITRLALYEPPFMAEVEDGARIKEYTERLHELLDAGRKGDAVALFMTHVGVPAPGCRRHAGPAGLGHARGDRPDARLRRRGARPAAACRAT